MSPAPKVAPVSATPVPAGKLAKDVSAPTPVKLDPSQIVDSHAAEAAAVDGSKDEAKIDLNALLTATDALQRDAAAAELVNLVKIEGPHAFVHLGLADATEKALNDKKNPVAREGACQLIKSLCNQGVGHAVEPFIFEKVLTVITGDALADKVTGVRVAAIEALQALVKVMSPWAATLLLPILLNQLSTNGKWQVKAGCLQILDQLVSSAPMQIANGMPAVVPVLADLLHDTKAEVKKAARSTITTACALISNKDIEKFIPALINCLIKPEEEVPKTIALLAATTFVSAVDSPTLSLMAPLLTRGLNERLTATRRKVAVIIDNMTKLVDDEHIVRPFLPKILPGLIKLEGQVSDPEARGVVARAIKTVQDIAKVEGDGSDCPPERVQDPKPVAANLMAAVKKFFPNTNLSATSPLVVYISQLAASLINARNYELTEWETALIPYVSLGVSQDVSKAGAIVKDTLERTAKQVGETVDALDDEEEGEDLCNCQFSLAYGAKILLNTATLRLKRGHRYGLCGRNGSGKSTLMRAIHNGQVEGFPSPEEVRTFYVEHDIDGSEADITVVAWILADKRIQATEDECRETLTSLGFNKVRQEEPIGGLSGGWKMKLALARAMLFKADILLLDEPTNHLDVINVQWLMDYLTSLTTCTSIIVSHDSGFLNNVCTDILHLNRFKVKRYRGNLEAFVKQVPEAKAYYELNALEEYQFKFPDPPLLDGVKTKEKSLAKMRNVGFRYPAGKTDVLSNITLQISLSSRVAVLGPNGSGKSTLVKLLVSETEPTTGEVWKHPNLVLGYVAQHAFHHIDNHLDKTPLEYMLYRYQTGEDIEELAKANRQITEADEKKMKEGANIVIEGQKRIIDEILARKKLKQSYEYECSLKGQSSSENIWLPRDDLLKRGFEKKVIALDTKEAQRLGMLRPLVRKEVESHFNDFGLESEFVTHNTMRGLSGGQKVKVVLAAACWRKPHVIILDEPTNYLDRESLAALIAALKVFEGGVLIITHNQEFSESICKEVWAMSNGTLTASGHNWVEGQGSGERLKNKDDEEDQFDAMGNKIENKKAKKLTSSELRKRKKDRMARRKRGEEVFTDEDEL